MLYKVGMEKINYDAVEKSSKNLKVSKKISTQSTLDRRTLYWSLEHYEIIAEGAVLSSRHTKFLK